MLYNPFFWILIGMFIRYFTGELLPERALPVIYLIVTIAMYIKGWKTNE